MAKDLEVSATLRESVTAYRKEALLDARYPALDFRNSDAVIFLLISSGHLDKKDAAYLRENKNRFVITVEQSQPNFEAKWVAEDFKRELFR